MFVFPHRYLYLLGWVGTFLFSQGYAQVHVQENEGSFQIQNRSPATLLHLKRGKSLTYSLTPGSTWRDQDRPEEDPFGQVLKPQITASISLKTWYEGLELLPGDSLWARINLQTAGLDLHRSHQTRSLLGAPHLAENILALRNIDEKISAQWAKGPPLQQGLVAYAARYIPPGGLLDQLLALHSPKEKNQVWPKEYTSLPSIHQSLRDAIEAHGSKALPMVLTYQAWAEDRGFKDPELALVLLSESDLIEALEKQNPIITGRFKEQLKEDELLYNEYQSRATESSLKNLHRVIKEGKIEEAITLAVRVAWIWHRYNMYPSIGQSTQMVCSYLDLGAQRSLNQKQLLAAEAYISFAQNICHGVPYFKARASEYLRIRGDQEYFVSNFESAQHWYRAALWLGNEIPDRVRLIDTLSQLSLIYNFQNKIPQAKAYLKEAQGLETLQIPTRELTGYALQMLPRVDYRAQLGIGILIFILIFSIISVLSKVFTQKKKVRIRQE
jgi:tetratricopeptide (TPR) repeat protein